MAFMTAVIDEQATYGLYSVNSLMNSSEGLIAGDMHVQNDPNAFVVQNSVTDLNASQPLRNDNEILSSDQFTLNQETHFLSDYGSGFTTNVSVYHDQVPAPSCNGNQPTDYSLIPNENDAFFSNSSHAVESNIKLENDIKAFLSKTSEPKEYKLREDIDNFVKNNSKAADKRMSEDIKAFLRRCRSPSPIEGAKLKPAKALTKSIYTRISRNTKKLISKSKAFSPEITSPGSPPRKPPLRSGRPKSVVTRRSSLNSNVNNKKVDSRSRSHEKTPNASRRKTFSRSRSRERSPNFIRRKTYSRSRSREKSPVSIRKRTYSRSRSPERIRKPLRESVSSNSSKPLPSRNSDRSSRDSKPREARDSNSRETRSQSFANDSKDAKILHPYQRRNRQEKSNELKDHEKKLETLSKLKPEEIIELEKKIWTKAELLPLYYRRQNANKAVCEATPMLLELLDKFEDRLIRKPEKVRASKPPYEPPFTKKKFKPCNHNHHKHNDGASSSSCSSSEEDDEDDSAMKILETKHKHPQSLHKELWFNDPGQMNDGVLCRCSAKAARSGIRHGIYQGETSIKPCNPNTNNLDRLYHYRITLSPPTNFLTKMPTIIEHDDHEYIFEGFSMFTHEPIGALPTCKVIRFNINYAILYIEEEKPENFVIRELDLFYKYVFHELLELVDFTLRPSVAEGETCPLFHFMPRFVRELPENGKEILSMGNVMKYLLRNYRLIVPPGDVRRLNELSTLEWQDEILRYKGMIVTYPGAKPSSVRVDQLNRDDKKDVHPEIVHFGIRPPQLSYAGNPEYQKAWRAYVKFRHLIANMPKPSFEDKRKLEKKEQRLQEMRTQSKMKRGVTVVVSSKNFYATGIMCDVVQHAMLLPVLVCHLRFHRSLLILEESIGYKFKNRYLLQLAMTHPSFRENFGTNPDHARNSLTNCGVRQPEYGDRRIHYMNTRKRGINTLINIMSRFGKKSETESNISHNERLEFLGDAVVEFITSIHLYHMFPDLEEGGLATYRAAIVQNQHLAVLGKVLNLQDYMLYAHGSDLCHELELRHAMANCFEALMGALFLDGGIEVPDKVFGEILFKGEKELLDVWVNYPAHPLQEQEPDHDRHWIQSFPLLQRLTQFEETIGVEFKHIRLLARAFTDRSVGYTNLTLGSNQRMEFLGDTVLQLIASDYLYRYFPEHHEGHLSLLRSSLVNNRTQSVVCDDLNIPAFALYSNPKAELKTKDRADLLESFLGALYIDKGLDYCRVFCNVCFFPRLQDFIMHQDWNDPKSKLQQCCLTLRTLDGGEPDIPIYKVIECKGPTNSRIYTVAVYFRRQRLADASGHSIQQAEMNAANSALEQSHGLFPQLDHQKRVIAKSMICNGRAITSGKGDRPNNNLRSVVQRRDIRDRFKRSNNVNNMRARRVNKQLGAKSAVEKNDGKPSNEPSRFFKNRDYKNKYDPERTSHKPGEQSKPTGRFDEGPADYRRRRPDESETSKKYDNQERKDKRDWEEEIAETERKEKIRKKISKIKNLGSKAAREKERLKKQKKILKLKKRLKLQLKVKKRLKQKEKLRKILLSADKLKRRLQLREKNLERQAYEIELKRKMLEENLKKQSNIIEVDRMRLILKGATGSSAVPGAEDSTSTPEADLERIDQPESIVSSQAPESLVEDVKPVKPETNAINEDTSIKVKSESSESIKTGKSTKIKTSPETKSSVKIDTKVVSSVDEATEKISSDEESSEKLKPSSPTSKEVLKLKTILEDIDKTKSEIKDKLDKRKKKEKGKKKKSTKDHDKSESHDSDKKSVLSKSSRSNKEKSDSQEGSSDLSKSPDHKRSRKESESSKSRSSRKKDRSRSLKRESSRKSPLPPRPRRGKKLDSPSPVKRKPKSKEPVKSSVSKPSPKTKDRAKSSLSKVSPRANDKPRRPSRPRQISRRSKSRSPYKGPKKRLSVSNSPKRSQRRRDSRSLSLSLSPLDKRHRSYSRSRSRSRSRGRYYNRHRSKSPLRSSRSPTSKFSKKSSRSSRKDQDEYIKYITNMSQSVCAGCTAGTCQMNSSHLVVPPNPHVPPMYGNPHMAYGPPPPHMYNRYPPPGAMRGPPPMRPHRFPVRGPPPPGAPPYGQRPPGPPVGPGPAPYAAPPYYHGGPHGPPGPPGPYYPPPQGYPGPGGDPNHNGPPNYWT